MPRLKNEELENFAQLMFDGDLKKGPAYKQATNKADLSASAANQQANRWLKRDDIKARLQELSDEAEFNRSYSKLDAKKNVRDVIKKMYAKVNSNEKGSIGAANTLLKAVNKLEDLQGEVWNDSANNEGNEMYVVNIVNNAGAPRPDAPKPPEQPSSKSTA